VNVAAPAEAHVSSVAGASPRPEPRFIGDPLRPVFAWHHAPPRHARRGAAVVLCPPLGHECLSAYRTWRVLADALAGSGFDVVRVDYDGTGSSAGLPDDPRRVEAWIASVAAALAHARSCAGSPAAALVGLRGGVTVALEAAARDGDVERLVAWSPFPSGRALVRELKALSGLTVERGATPDPDDGSVNAAGYVFGRDTLDALAAWSIEGIARPPAPHVLLVDHDERPPDARLADRLTSSGARVDRVRPKGTAAMLVPPQHAAVPSEAVRAIVEWLEPWRSERVTADAWDGSTADARASVEGWTERPVRFGPAERLFGVLTTPRHGPPSRPSIVVFGTGVEYQAGQHRLYVPLARDWASRGHAVLRFDLGGIGDSLAPDGSPDDETYPAHAVDDAREAVGVLRTAAPSQPVLLAGFCSGGLAAVRAAASGVQVAGVACVNVPLQLLEGAAGPARLRDVRELDRYRQAAASPPKWIKALTGRAAYRTLLALALRAARERAVRGLAGRLGSPLPAGLSATLDGMSRRGVRSVFAFSDSEDALAYFDAQAAAALRRPGIRRLVSRIVVEGAGHTFRPRAAQRALVALLDDFVRG
jgi:alpha-beta hydrolase superfamily lysophospholipase